MSTTFRTWFIKLFLPYASWWVARQERRILNEGVRLSELEASWAASVGVQDVEKVRLLYVSVVPLPGSPLLNYFADLIRYPIAPIGLAAGHGIYLSKECRTDPSLLVHELVHVAQYERYGGIRPFLVEYLEECFRDGYWNAEMEHEARGAAIPYNRPPDR
ncbi:MAG: hypothetical protein P1U89_25210 [Verrucomicrobiales bacterium]|nr:hypothetical protein [Verrucomicrobiales bacterium]